MEERRCLTAYTSPAVGLQFAASNLGPGTYDLKFTGTGSSVFSAYVGRYATNPSVAPETSTALMALLGATRVRHGIAFFVDFQAEDLIKSTT
jgi:hypothetical protein